VPPLPKGASSARRSLVPCGAGAGAWAKWKPGTGWCCFTSRRRSPCAQPIVVIEQLSRWLSSKRPRLLESTIALWLNSALTSWLWVLPVLRGIGLSSWPVSAVPECSVTIEPLLARLPRFWTRPGGRLGYDFGPRGGIDSTNGALATMTSGKVLGKGWSGIRSPRVPDSSMRDAEVCSSRVRLRTRNGTSVEYSGANQGYCLRVACRELLVADKRQVLAAPRGKREPWVAAEDNLGTLKLALAIPHSAELPR
jgi:hypothetical protein